MQAIGNKQLVVSAMAAVGLTSSRSILEIIGLETPERSARSARDQLRRSRSSRTRCAIWDSVLADVSSIISIRLL